MKRIISILLALCLLAGCGIAGAESTHLQGKPWVNSNIFGQWPDEQPGPEIGYDMYANYDLYRKALADGFKGTYAPLIQGEDTVEEQFLALCTDPEKSGTEEQCLQILYRLYMDAEKREQDGIAPLQPYLSRLKAVKTLDELTALILEDGWMYGDLFFSGSLDSFENAGGIYTLTLERADAIEYLPMEDVTAGMPDLDVESPKKKLILMGFSEEEAAGVVEKILAAMSPQDDIIVETDLETDIQDRGTASLNELREVCPPLPDLITARGLVREGTEADRIYKVTVSDIIWFRNLYREENLEVLKAVIMLGMYKQAESVLPDAGKDGETASVSDFIYYVPEAVKEQAYLRACVPQDRLEMFYHLADEYKEALRIRIEQSSWLGEETKKESLRKLDRLVASKLEYPYGDIDCGPLLEKLRACETMLEANGLCALFDRECMAHFSGRDYVRGNRFKSGYTVLRCEGKYVPEVNIFYLGGGSLTIVADASSRETILGSVGVLLAHELSHGFDTKGSQFNADYTGSLFTEEDQRIFSEKAEAISRQISAIEPLNRLDGNGPVKIGEVLADLTGMSLTLDLARKDANFDYDAFFRAFARFFVCYMREGAIEEDVRLNPHPLSYIRINFTVQHFDEFYQTYPSVTEGTPMYMAPEDRLLIW